MRTLLVLLLLSLMLPRPLLAQVGHADACIKAVAGLAMAHPMMMQHDESMTDHSSMAQAMGMSHDMQAMMSADEGLSMHHAGGYSLCTHCGDCQAQAPVALIACVLPAQMPAPESNIAFVLPAYHSPAIDRLDRPPACC